MSIKIVKTLYIQFHSPTALVLSPLNMNQFLVTCGLPMLKQPQTPMFMDCHSSFMVNCSWINYIHSMVCLETPPVPTIGLPPVPAEGPLSARAAEFLDSGSVPCGAAARLQATAKDRL